MHMLQPFSPWTYKFCYSGTQAVKIWVIGLRCVSFSKLHQYFDCLYDHKQCHNHGWFFKGSWQAFTPFHLLTPSVILGEFAWPTVIWCVFFSVISISPHGLADLMWRWIFCVVLKLCYGKNSPSIDLSWIHMLCDSEKLIFFFCKIHLQDLYQHSLHISLSF